MVTMATQVQDQQQTPGQRRLSAWRSGRSIGGVMAYGAIASLIAGCNVSQPPSSSATASSGMLPMMLNTASPSPSTPVLPEGQGSPPVNGEPMPVVDRVIQYPDAPLPVQVFEVVSLTADQVNGLNGMYQRFAKVDARTEPIAPGSATVHNEWAALCLGEENQAGCPKSAVHQLISYGEFWRANQFVTSGGWVLYKP